LAKPGRPGPPVLKVHKEFKAHLVLREPLVRRVLKEFRVHRVLLAPVRLVQPEHPGHKAPLV
jgi:hypothetical protein